MYDFVCAVEAANARAALVAVAEYYARLRHDYPPAGERGRIHAASVTRGSLDAAEATEVLDVLSDR